MDPRKISVKLRRDPRETAERHSQANPLTLECTLASGETVTEAMDLRAELHAAQTPATTPLATTATVVMASGSTGPWELEFSGAQMNQTVLPDSAEDFWLVIYATNAADDLFTLGKIALTLTFDNVSQSTPPPPEPPLYATYAFRTIAVAGQSSVVAETTADTLTLVAGSNITLTTNAATDTITIAASGGGGGTTNLTMTRTANAVTITPSGGGTAAEIPQASNTHAGVLTAAHHIALDALGTMSTQSAASVAITGGTITGTTVSGVTLSGSATPTLAVSGTTSVSGTNTGNVTLAAEISSIMTLTGQVIGAVTDPGADRIVFFDQSANAGAGAWGYLTAGTGLNITGTTLTAAIAGTGSEIQFRDSATGALAAVPGTSVSGSTIILGAGDNLGTGTAERLRLRNTTPAVSGTNQNSPAIAFEGSAWQTSASASQAVETRAYIIPQAGSSIAAGRLVFEFRLNGGAWTEIAAFRAGFGSSGLFLGTGSAANITTSNSSLGVYTSTNQFTFSTSTTGGHFVGPFSVRSGANDATLNADAAHQMAQRSGTNAQTFRVYDTFASATDFHRVGIATARATLPGLSGASVTATALIPAGAVVVGVTAKVLTAVTGATSWQLGTAADPDRFAAAGGIALGSTTDNTNWTAGGIECFLAATNIVLTANGSNFTGGSVYISVQYIRGEAD